jgi:serine/threonine protein kinase
MSLNDFEPKQFGKYFLLKKMAVGGMAEIYRAKTYGIDGFEKQLAIKRILPHCSADKDFITMLIDEAKLSVLLSHANIVQVYDLGKVGDDYYISMEYIHGVNLRDTLYKCREQNEQIPEDIGVYIASEICKGLDYAHRKTDHNNQPLNIVHRDVSPQNILISYEGEVKIVDFGIAKAAMNISHTMAGILKGKIAYMSPEQAMGKKIDRRTDIFSAGILLYEMLSGQKLYTGESQFELLKKIRTTQITEAVLPDSIPEGLRPIVAKALAYNVENRYQNAGDMQIELTKYLYSTHVEFSPRKLSKFIAKVFAGEIKEEQTEVARESAVEDLTGSVNTAEGARQMDIVRREPSLSRLEETTAGKREAGGGDLDTQLTPIQKKGAAPPPSPRARIQPKKKKKKSPIFKWLMLIIVFSLIGYVGLKVISPSKIIKHFMKPSQETGQTTTPEVERFGSATITSVPSEASVILDGQDTGRKTPTQLEDLSIGKSYKIRVEKENFNPAEKEIQITSAEPIAVNLVLPEPKGIVNIITDPPGAAIMVDDKLTGLVSPVTLESLSIGKDIKITLQKPGYENFEQTINLTSTKPQQISMRLVALAPKLGSLAVDSEPKGASIILDGQDTGRTTPATIQNLEPKSYSVEVSLNGYETWKSTVDVQNEKTAETTANLIRQEKTIGEQVATPEEEKKAEEAKKAAEQKTEETKKVEEQKAEEAKKAEEVKKAAALTITSDPPGASITIDGRPTGRTTPATIKDLKTGATYSIRLDKEGFETATRRKAVKAESEKLYVALMQKKMEEQTPTPQPPTEETQPPQEKTPPPATYGAGAEPGKVRVTSEPSGADVFINSEYKGKTPITASVPAGTASVLINKDGLSRTSKTVTVQPGRTVDVSARLGDIYGEVTLDTTPPRAQVIFDGQAIPAKTPVTVRKVRTDRQHTVTVELPGYAPWSRTFSMEGQTSKTFNITLQPR